MDPAADSPPRFGLTTRFEERGRLTVGFDDVEVSQHGVHHTHFDAWNHYGLDGTFFPGVGTDRPGEAGIDRWAAQGVVTRAVLLDVTEVRGTGWIDASEPVTGAELQAALELTGGGLHRGDALLVHLGRDRFEKSGERYRTIPAAIAAGVPRAGLGTGAAEWIASQPVSVVCWDFLDAVHPDQPHGPVHLLIWAIGLGLVDNCRLGPAVEAMRAEGRWDGLLTIAPLVLPGATASLVSPLLVL